MTTRRSVLLSAAALAGTAIAGRPARAAEEIGVGLPSSAVAERYEVPWLNFGTVDRITQRGFRYVFRPHANDTLKARALVEGIISLAANHGGLKSGVILSENTEWGKSVADKQKTFLQQAGVDI